MQRVEITTTIHWTSGESLSVNWTERVNNWRSFVKTLISLSPTMSHKCISFHPIYSKHNRHNSTCLDLDRHGMLLITDHISFNRPQLQCHNATILFKHRLPNQFSNRHPCQFRNRHPCQFQLLLQRQ